MRKSSICLAGALALSIAAAARGDITGVPSDRNPSGSMMRVFETPYYTLHTDLSEAEAREADLRMTRMFEEYQRRTSDFAGQVKKKFPFFLYRNKADYLAAGAPNGSAGVYIEWHGNSWLIAVAGPKTSAYTWHVVQHEGFHQFIRASLQNDIPIWANEGLAEYFGEGIWTGDGFVTGLIAPDRLEDVKKAIQNRTFRPFAQMMTMTDEEWGNKLEYSNYNQAWAMVHFLAHAENGKYQQAFLAFMNKVSRGAPPINAWTDVFGGDTGAFERRFADYWMALGDNPSRSAYLKALVQTETSFLARATIQRQTFPDPSAFFRTYKPADLELNRDLWLPPALFTESSTAALKVGDWTLEGGNGPPRLVCKDEDGSKYIGTFAIANGKVGRVSVEVLKAGSTANNLRPTAPVSPGGRVQRTAPSR